MKKVLSVLFAILMLLSMVSVSSAEETVVDLSVWGTNNGFLPVEKGSPLPVKCPTCSTPTAWKPHSSSPAPCST